MSAMEVMQNLLIDQVAGPVGLDTGGVSKNDPTAGTDPGPLKIQHGAIKTGDKVGAAFLTVLVAVIFFGGGWWMTTVE